MKTIGVLGGIGPQATIDFETRVHQASQRLIPAQGNSGYPPMIVYYHRRPPFVMRADGSHPVSPLQADPDLLQAARWLGERSHFLVIVANGPHLVQDEVERVAGRAVLSIIQVTLDEVRRREWQSVGILGFRDPSVYTQPISRLGLGFKTLGAHLRSELDASILAFMEGRQRAGASAIVRDAVADLRASGVDGIILGCTEIPLLLGEHAEAFDLVNPAHLLAEAAVKHALA